MTREMPFLSLEGEFPMTEADRQPEHNRPPPVFIAPHRPFARALLDELCSAALGRVARDRLNAAQHGDRTAQQELVLIGLELLHREGLW